MTRPSSFEELFSDPAWVEILGPVKKSGGEKKTGRLSDVTVDVLAFFEKENRLPQEGGPIMERRLATRFKGFLATKEGCVFKETHSHLFEQLDVEEVGFESLEEMLTSGFLDSILDVDSIFECRHVRAQDETEKSAPAYVGQRTLCVDFEKFAPVFAKVHEDVKAGSQELVPLPKAGTSSEFGTESAVRVGHVFSLDGVLVYVAYVSGHISKERGAQRVRLIFENEVESDILLGSFGAALRKDVRARWLRPTTSGPLFDFKHRETHKDQEAQSFPLSGYIYVLRSLSQEPALQNARHILKIGRTSNSVSQRLQGAETSPTYLCAPVEVVAEYAFHGFNMEKVERTLHLFFESAQLNVSLLDRWGKPYKPQEWFLVPPKCIKDAIDGIQNNTLHLMRYDPETGRVKVI